jgi:hypothetical protein
MEKKYWIFIELYMKDDPRVPILKADNSYKNI